MRDDSYYRCLCGTHVHKGTLIIAVLGFIGNVIGLVGSLVSRNSGAYFLAFPVLHGLSLLSNACLLIGNRQEKPALYWPHLIINAILLVGLFLAIVGYSVAGGLFMGHKVEIEGATLNHFTQKEIDAIYAIAGIICFVIAFFYFIGFLISLYFYRVVYRGYRYLNDVLLNPASTVPRIV